MKIISLDHHDTPRLIADSALSRIIQPLFLPQLQQGSWQACTLLQIKIGKLGKHIAPQFAHRYCQGIGLALHMQPSEPTLRPQALLYDFTLALSEADPLTEATPAHLKQNVADAITQASRYTTLRTGDIILLPIPGAHPQAITDPRQSITIQSPLLPHHTLTARIHIVS